MRLKATRGCREPRSVDACLEGPGRLEDQDLHFVHVMRLSNFSTFVVHFLEKVSTSFAHAILPRRLLIAHDRLDAQPLKAGLEVTAGEFRAHVIQQEVGWPESSHPKSLKGLHGELCRSSQGVDQPKGRVQRPKAGHIQHRMFSLVVKAMDKQDSTSMPITTLKS